MTIPVANDFMTRRGKLRGIIFAVLVFIIALLVRGYRIGDIQPHHDESPAFGFARGEPLAWEGSPALFLHELCNNAAVISEGDSPPMIGITAEIFRFIFGENLLAARWFHAVLQALGVALTSWLAWYIFRPARFPVAAVSGLAIFSVVSVFYGQFGEVYAIYFLAGTAQCLAYWMVLRGRYSWPRYTVFAITAYLCGLFQYIQVWLILGLLAASVLETGSISRPRRLLRAASAFMLYGLFNLIPFFFLMTKMSLSAGHLGYYFRYYPALSRGAGFCPAATELIRYLLTRSYDLFNYHISLVFHSSVYSPLKWNWVSLPFILVAAGALVIWIKKGRRESHGIFSVLVSVLFIFLLGNFLFLLPYGGLRNTILLSPVIWLGYGEAVAQWDRIFGRGWFGKVVSCLLVGICLLPFVFSLPRFYQDRVSRVDLAALAELIARHRPDTLIMAEATYDPFRMILQRHPDFQKEVLDRYGVELTSFFELGEERWGKYPLPVPGENVMALDFYIPENGKGVGYGIFAYHPTLAELSGPDWEFETLLEAPGNNLDLREHQSIYYPPNSVYIYLMRRK